MDEEMNSSTETDLDKEFSPSMWTKRFPNSKNVVDHFEQFVKKASVEAVNNIPNELEIIYGSTPGQRLDILGTDLPNDSPIFVWVHGGYWQSFSRPLSRHPALSLYPAKIKTIIVGYDLCPIVTLPEIIKQIQNAVKFVLQYAETMDSKGVYLAGHSAGAHLIAKVLASKEFIINTAGSHRLRAAILVSGVYDLRDLIKTKVNDPMQLSENQAKECSPNLDDFTHLQNGNLRVYIIAGQYDSSAFKKQSRNFYEKLQRTLHSKTVYLEIKDGFDHFDIVECYANIENYLKSLLLHDIIKYVEH